MYLSLVTAPAFAAHGYFCTHPRSGEASTVVTWSSPTELEERRAALDNRAPDAVPGGSRLFVRLVRNHPDDGAARHQEFVLTDASGAEVQRVRPERTPEPEYVPNMKSVGMWSVTYVLDLADEPPHPWIVMVRDTWLGQVCTGPVPEQSTDQSTRVRAEPL